MEELDFVVVTDESSAVSALVGCSSMQQRPLSANDGGLAYEY